VTNVLNFKRICVSYDDRTHRPGECRHLHLRLDSRGGIVSCADCNASLSPFWALTMLSEQYKLALSNIDDLSARLLLAHNQIVALTHDSARVVDGSKDS
jgi:hypothetical protein